MRGATVIEIYPRKIAVILGAFTDMVIFRRGMFAVSMAGGRRGGGGERDDAGFEGNNAKI